MTQPSPGSPRAARPGEPLTTLVLGADDMTALLTDVGPDRMMDLMIDRLRARYLDLADHPVQARDRDGFRYDKPALGLLEWMPTHEIAGPVTVKMVGYHPTNPTQRRLPSVIATTSMWDTETGHLVAIADATLLTAIRTGAASGLATDLMAVDRPITLGVVGLGAQAVTQVHAVSRVRPIERIVAIDADVDVAATFTDRISFLEVPVEIAPPERCATIAGEVDVLCTCTSVDIGAGPVVGAADVRPWLHVNAVGADFPGKTELPLELLERSVVVPDVLSQCLVEGECQQLLPTAIGSDLVEIVQHPERHAGLPHVPTVYDSTGWAVQDAVALQLAVELACQRGLGNRIRLELIPHDPYNPYDRRTNDTHEERR
jgi:ornithine cyclodeaminase/alanine dehydrogenase-like protein (mu-crystallin family)